MSALVHVIVGLGVVTMVVLVVVFRGSVLLSLITAGLWWWLYSYHPHAAGIAALVMLPVGVAVAFLPRWLDWLDKRELARPMKR